MSSYSIQKRLHWYLVLLLIVLFRMSAMNSEQLRAACAERDIAHDGLTKEQTMTEIASYEDNLHLASDETEESKGDQTFSEEYSFRMLQLQEM